MEAGLGDSGPRPFRTSEKPAPVRGGLFYFSPMRDVRRRGGSRSLRVQWRNPVVVRPSRPMSREGRVRSGTASGREHGLVGAGIGCGLIGTGTEWSIDGDGWVCCRGAHETDRPTAWRLRQCQTCGHKVDSDLAWMWRVRAPFCDGDRKQSEARAPRGGCPASRWAVCGLEERQRVQDRA